MASSASVSGGTRGRKLDEITEGIPNPFKSGGTVRGNPLVFTPRERDEELESGGIYGASQQRSTTPNYLAQAGQMINQPIQNPFLPQYQDYYQKVMAPGYEAFTPEQLNAMYQTQSGQLKEDVFSQWEDAMSERLANQNLAGSGAAKMDWEKLLGREGGALGALKGDIWNYGQNATREDIARAIGSAPIYQGQNADEQREAWNRLTQYLGIQQGEKAGQQQRQQANASGLASLIPFLIKAIAGVAI